MGISNSQLGIFFQFGIEDWFSESALPDSDIPNPKSGILSPTGDLISPIRDNIPNWEFFLLIIYYFGIVNRKYFHNIRLSVW